MVSFLKRAWNFWSKLLNFDWLDRLHQKHPRLATAINGSLISLVLGLFGWFHIDPRFRMFIKGGYTSAGTPRYFQGGLFMILAVFTLAWTIFIIKNDTPVIWEYSSGKTRKKRKGR